MGAKRLLLALAMATALAAPLAALCYGPVTVDRAKTPSLLSDNDALQRPGLRSVKHVPSQRGDEPGATSVTDAAASQSQLTPDSEPPATNTKIKMPAVSAGRGVSQPLGALPAAHDRGGAHAVTMDSTQPDAGQGMDTEVNPEHVGLKVRALSDAERRDLGITEGGLRIIGVDGGSAENAGFRTGDVVLMLDGVAVTSPAQFRKLVRRLPHDRPVPVLVRRPNSSLFLPLDASGH